MRQLVVNVIKAPNGNDRGNIKSMSYVAAPSSEVTYAALGSWRQL